MHAWYSLPPRRSPASQILYEAMHTRIHPLGVPYTAVYDFLNCLAISPCRGWLTSNATMRAATQQRADQLSAVLQTLVFLVSGLYFTGFVRSEALRAVSNNVPRPTPFGILTYAHRVCHFAVSSPNIAKYRQMLPLGQQLGGERDRTVRHLRHHCLSTPGFLWSLLHATPVRAV